MESGSSPLARGTFRLDTVDDVEKRLIPARAGNISAPPPAGKMMAAHPRSRGEHSTAEAKKQVMDGSSPLARGTWFHCRHVPARPRLIPARAGNIKKLTDLRGGKTAHPRSRGEHLVPLAWSV